MNKKLVERMRKLSRHRQFLQGQAHAQLQSEIQQTRKANEHLQESQSRLESVSLWKKNAASNGDLDLTIYQHALYFEELSENAVQEADLAVKAAEVQQRVASDCHAMSRKASNVVGERLECVTEDWLLQQEHALSDQIADLWLANKEGRT